MERDIKEILLSEEQIQNRIAELGKILTEEYKDKNPIIVGVLKGVVVFYADMIRHIKVPCQLDFMWISSYAGANSSGNMVVRQDVSADVKGRHVLILEDIFDTGNSLNFTYQHLLSKGAASVKICTLFDKPARHKVEIEVDYNGLEVPDEFIVGYGLDYAESYRNYPEIAVLKPSVYED